MRVTLGRVTTREDARQHLNIHGLAYCGAGTGRTIKATRHEIDGTAVLEAICLRCLPALRRHVAAAAATGDPYAADAAYAIAPADVVAAREAELTADLATFHTHLAAQRNTLPAPLTWDARQALRAELLGTPTTADLLSAAA